MSLKRTLLKNTSYNLAGYFFLSLASIISVPIILASLGKTTYGILVLFSSFIPLMGTMDLGLSPAVIRELALPKNTPEKRLEIWQTSFWLFIGIGIFGMLVSTVFFLGVIRTWEDVFQLSHSDFSWAVLLLAVTVLLDNLNAHFLTLPQADHRFEIYNLRTLIVGTGNTFGTALVAYLTRSIPLILAFRIILYFITSLSLIKYAGKSLKTSHIWPKFNLHIAKKLTGFGLKNFIGKLANQLSYQFSNYAIGGMLSAGAVAAFSIPQNLIVKAAGAISQGTLAFFPLSTQLSSKEKIHKLRIFVITIEVLILIIGITEVLFIKFFGFTFLTLWLNDSELAIQAYPVLRILSWVFLLTTLTPIPTAVLNALNYPQVPSFFALLTSIGTISLIFLLTTQLGVIGPAYAALISSAITVPSFLITFVWIFIKFKPKE